MPSVVLDGNFTAQHRRMKRPEDDVPIADGHAFMVRKGPYKAHLAATLKRPDPVRPFLHDVYTFTQGWIKREPLTCNDHRAVLESRKKKKDHLDVNGIGAAACSRHGCFIPHSVVDFPNGEG